MIRVKVGIKKTVVCTTETIYSSNVFGHKEFTATSRQAWKTLNRGFRCSQTGLLEDLEKKIGWTKNYGSLDREYELQAVTTLLKKY